MARIKGTKASRISNHRLRTVNVQFSVKRLGIGFMACYRPSGQHMARYPDQRCVRASNPRKALAGAMRKAAKYVGGRRGAFARYK